MTKKLAVPMLILGLALYGGCGSSSSSNTGGTGGTATGGGGGSTGGSGGGTGGAATGGSGGGTGGATGGSGGGTGGAGVDGGSTDGSAADGSASDTAAGETATSADFCAGYVAGSGMLANKAAADFCAEYATVCTFTGDMRYMNMGDCVSKYMAAAASVQTCRAGHLCNAKAGDAAGKATHCPHATGLGGVMACQ